MTLGSNTLVLSNASGSFAGDIGSDAAGGGLEIATGTETLTGTNLLTGTTTIDSGATLDLSGGSIAASSVNVLTTGLLDISGGSGSSIKSLAGAGNVNLGGNVLTLSNGSGSFSGIISGTGASDGLTVNGTGIETLSGVNTYTGATIIGSGETLKLSGSGSIATSSGVTDNGTFDISLLSSSIQSLSGSGAVTLGLNTLTITNGNSADVFSGAINGSNGSLTITGGTVTLSGANTYTGATTINGGTLAIAGTGTIATSSGVTDNGTFDISGASASPAPPISVSIKTLSGSLSSHVYLGQNTLVLTDASGTYDGVIADTGGIAITDSGGGLEISVTNALHPNTETLTGTNTYTGTTKIDAGATLNLSGSGSLANSSVVLLAAAGPPATHGTFNISGTTAGASIKSLAGDATTVVNLGARTLTLSAANPLDTFSGVIGGSGGLTLDTGTETLGGINTYSGATTITGGTLALTGTGSISNSSGVDAEGTLDISALGGGTSISTLSGSGALVLGANTLTLTGANDTFSGSIGGTGGITVSAGTEKFAGTTSYSGTTNVGSGAFLWLLNGGDASSVANVAGTLNLSGAGGGVSLKSLTGTGTVSLGTNTLTLASAGDNFSGVINGTGGLTISGGSETLSSADTYTGATTIASGATLTLSGSGAIAHTSGVQADGTFDISSSSGAQIANLSGAATGTLALGSKSLTITSGIGTFNGKITGSGSLALNGTGTETFTFNNDSFFTGATTIGSGETLALTGSGSLGGSAVAANGTLDISGVGTSASIKSLSGAGGVTLGIKTLILTNASGTFSGVISDPPGGNLEIAGGSETLSGINTYSGTTTIDPGASLLLSGAGSIAFSNVADNGTFDIHLISATSTSIQALTGTSVVTLGAKTLTVHAGGSFSGSIGGTGAFDIEGGAFALTGTGAITAAGGVIDNATFDIASHTGNVSIATLSGTNSGASVVLGSNTLILTNAGGDFAGDISGLGGLTIAGGSETLSGNNDYTGATTIDFGATLTVTGSLSASSAIVNNGTFNGSGGGALSFAYLSGGGNIVLGASGLTLTGPGTGSYSGVLSGAGGLTVQNTVDQTLTGHNLYTGATQIDNGGILRLAGTGSIATSSGVNVDGTFDIVGLTNGGASIKTLSGAGAGNVTLGANTLTLTAAAGNFSGNIGGSGGLTISGGSETLSGNNALTGTTTIASLATLQLGDGTSANGTVVGNITDNGALKFSYTGSATTGGTITGTGSLTQLGGTTILTANDNYSGGTTISGGTLQLGNGGSKRRDHGQRHRQRDTRLQPFRLLHLRRQRHRQRRRHATWRHHDPDRHRWLYRRNTHQRRHATDRQWHHDGLHRRHQRRQRHRRCTGLRPL